MILTYLVAVLLGTLTLFVMVALHAELELPWLIIAPVTLPIVIAGVAIAKGISHMTGIQFLEAILGLGVVLYLLAGGYQIVTRPPG